MFWLSPASNHARCSTGTGSPVVLVLLLGNSFVNADDEGADWENVELQAGMLLKLQDQGANRSSAAPLTYAVKREALCPASLTSVSGIGSLYSQPSAMH